MIDLARLNDFAAPTSESDRFAIRDGVLIGYADTRWRQSPALLPALRQAIEEYLDSLPTGSRLTFGIEIGAAVAKLYGVRWPSGEPAIDVKLQLTRLEDMRDPLTDYNTQIETLILAFQLRCLVPPSNIDLDDPARILEGSPGAPPHLTYVYGTQGPREALRSGLRLPTVYLRVLTPHEEALLIFTAIVPPEFANAPGTMAIEIGSRSTELVLVDASRRRLALAFAIGGNAQAGLDEIVRSIEAGELQTAARYLETDIASASEFMEEAHRLRDVPGRALFINPNRDSESFRTAAPKPGEIDVPWASHYAQNQRQDKFVPKALILASLAKAFGLSVIREGRKGGLKRAMAQFIAGAAGLSG